MLKANELGPLRVRMSETFEFYLLTHTSLISKSKKYVLIKTLIISFTNRKSLM